MPRSDRVHGEVLPLAGSFYHEQIRKAEGGGLPDGLREVIKNMVEQSSELVLAYSQVR